jgi:hypothetical protein
MSEEIENGVDVDEFFEGAEEATETAAAEFQEEVTEVGEEATEKPAEDAKPEEKPNVSITDLLDDDDVDDDELVEKPHAEGFVSVDKHIKLRERAQVAEAEVERLKSQTTRTDAENSGPEIDDDDFVTGKDMNKLAAKIKADAETDADARYEAKHAKDLVKSRTKKAVADQEVMLAEGPADYLDVIEAMRLSGISPEAKKQIRNAPNAAEEAYKIGCQILNRKPAQKRKATDAPTNANKNKAEHKAGLTEEEEIFDDIYN